MNNKELIASVAAKMNISRDETQELLDNFWIAAFTIKGK